MLSADIEMLISGKIFPSPGIATSSRPLWTLKLFAVCAAMLFRQVFDVCWNRDLNVQHLFCGGRTCITALMHSLLLTDSGSGLQWRVVAALAKHGNSWSHPPAYPLILCLLRWTFSHCLSVLQASLISILYKRAVVLGRNKWCLPHYYWTAPISHGGVASWCLTQPWVQPLIHGSCIHNWLPCINSRCHFNTSLNFTYVDS